MSNLLNDHNYIQNATLKKATLLSEWHPEVSLPHVQTTPADERSYSTLGPVSAWVGDRLWTGKPPRCGARHRGLLSLRAGVKIWRKPRSKQAYRVTHQPVFMVSQCLLTPGWWLASRDQCRLREAVEHPRRDATMRYTNTLLIYFTHHQSACLPVIWPIKPVHRTCNTPSVKTTQLY